MLVAALEAGHDHDVALVELLMHARRRDIDDAALRMHVVRLHARELARERDGRLAQRAKRHGEQGDGDLLARREQHIHLSRVLVRILRNALRELDEIIRRVAHRRDDDDDLVARLFLLQYTFGDVHDLFRGRHGAAAELLDNNCHNAPPK